MAFEIRSIQTLSETVGCDRVFHGSFMVYQNGLTENGPSEWLTRRPDHVTFISKSGLSTYLGADTRLFFETARAFLPRSQRPQR